LAASVIVELRPAGGVLVGHARAPVTASFASQQSPQQPLFSFEITRAELLILSMARLRAFKGLSVDNGRDGDRNPLGRGPPDLLTAGWFAVGRRNNLFLGTVVVQSAHIVIPTHNLVDARFSPPTIALRCEDAFSSEAFGDLPDACRFVRVPAKDLPHHFGLGVIDHHVSRNVTLSRHVVVAGRHVGPENLSLASSV